MSTITRCLAVGTAVLGLSATCFAAGNSVTPQKNTSECPPPRFQSKGGPEGGPGKFGDFHKQHMQKLHDDLKLSASQEKAWTAFAAHPEKAERPDFAKFHEMEKLPAPERMTKRIEGMKKQLAEMKDCLPKVKSFYNQLNSEQKKIFDSEFMPHRGPMGPGPQMPPPAAGDQVPPPPPAKDFDGKPATERMEKGIERMSKHIADLESLQPKVKDFYAKLSPEQQKTFDREFMNGGHHGPRGPHGRGGPRGPRPGPRPAPQTK